MPLPNEMGRLIKNLIKDGGKNIFFKFISDGAIWLGTPRKISALPSETGDGCRLIISTLNSSVGIDEKFEISLSEADISLLTKRIWEVSLSTSPSALKNLKEILNELRQRD